jgi:putative peptide zinc metalloprotease protein
MQRQLFVLGIGLLLMGACAPPDGGAATPVPKPDQSPSAAGTAAASPAAAASPVAAESPVAAAPRPSLTAGDQSGLQAAGTIDVSPPPGFKDYERGGSRNVVTVLNTRDGRFRAEGKAELDRVRGDEVTPTNYAEARASCTDCQTFAVALQVAIYRRGANMVAPVNRALAVNENCTRCVTFARAIQYVIPVDDFREIPREVNELVRRIDQEMRYFERIRDVTDVDPEEAEARLNQLVGEFNTLDQFLSDIVDLKEDNTTPTTPSAVPTPSVTPATPATATAGGTPTPAGSPTRIETPVPIGSPAAKP